MSNVIVDPQALLRLSIPYFALLLVCTGTIVIIHRKILFLLQTAMASSSDSNPTIAVLSSVMDIVTSTGVWGLGLFGMVCLIAWVIYSHRIFGPTVPIKRHLDNLINGRYDSRITLRPGDEFKDIADQLNVLAERLQAGKK